ncbi:glycosyltransferase family 1 protein [Fictibacillus sp. b24]|uniref:glycosyltransferase family 1 protein n=1 Tax=Fictibacillus sp. b24 TaxID=3055863 RepID=UPI0025A18C07|nr:glycosyltransferase family 1 protein [Fictibacillus sp. b24]MDM5314904.1 glycosyltransferase family 1 protein [Fictibacillus sp. b24]
MSEVNRVGVVIGKWINYGVETLVFNCYRHVDKEKIQFDFIIDEDSVGIPRDEIESMGGRVIIVPPYQKINKYISELTKLFKKNKYKIVHAHISTLSVFPLYAAKKAGVPIRIAHCHTTAGKGEVFKNIMKYSLRPLSKIFPTHLAASSRLGGEWLFGNGCFETYDMYYLPVARDVETFTYNKKVRDTVRTELGINNKFAIGHFGRFVAQKNHSFLIDVFKEIKSIEPNAVLLLAGDGELLNETKEKVSNLNLTNSVQFLGKRNDVAQLYQALDVFVLPSLYEGVPGVGIEAQSAGLPFVFSDTITEEVRILDTSKRLSFKDGVKQWAEIIVSLKGATRENKIKEMTEAGYNIKAAAKNLQQYYMTSIEKNNK